MYYYIYYNTKKEKKQSVSKILLNSLFPYIYFLITQLFYAMQIFLFII